MRQILALTGILNCIFLVSTDKGEVMNTIDGAIIAVVTVDIQ